ncbi:hypothetical protein [Halopiger goleimassiliensis]|uniref:hypothetical protein n=1 Tax=Halopiger goleimassiliensis TaxID=1293048 RepID=UPI00067767B2|nr:hypothetical protein [Halopiger goleimassiliensis]
MSRKTAVTEERSYATDRCHVCDTEVALDDVPDDVVEPRGYAVVLGEGSVSRESEEAGNWDEEIQFELDQDATELPTVSAYVVCEDCTESIHGLPSETPPYTGRLPREIAAGSDAIGSGAFGESNALAYLVGAVFLLLVLLVLFF